MQMIYLSPVPWSSFPQRPHKFVGWFHASTGARVLWMDPYLTRFPAPTDFRYLQFRKGKEAPIQPEWIRVIGIPALPIEPLPGSGFPNALIWRKTLNSLSAFVDKGKTILTIGKPSVFALAAIEQLRGCHSLYDAMDNFPNFYSGISRLAVRKRERRIVRQVDVMWVSSTALKEYWEMVRSDLQLVHNGVDASALPAPGMVERKDQKVLGYMGTIAAWFDWDWVIALARKRPEDEVRLVGPVFTHIPRTVPGNVKIFPPCDHRAAMEAMSEFDVGLIPFKKNDLTASVDPIKYYEYRAIGLPVISTDFGEMKLRAGEEGTFLSVDYRDIPDLVEEALRCEIDHEAVEQFIVGNTWESRFGSARIH